MWLILVLNGILLISYQNNSLQSHGIASKVQQTFPLRFTIFAEITKKSEDLMTIMPVMALRILMAIMVLFTT